MPAPIRPVAVVVVAVAAEVVAAEAEAAEAAVAAVAEKEVVEAAAVPPSQCRLFAVALPLLVRPSRSAQRLPLRLYLLPWPPVWPALFWAR